MLETIEGIYENGQVQIDRPPHNIVDKTQVLVTFLDPNNIDPAKLSELIDRIVGISQGIEDIENQE